MNITYAHKGNTKEGEAVPRRFRPNTERFSPATISRTTGNRGNIFHMICNYRLLSSLSIGPILSSTSLIDGGLVIRSQFTWHELWLGTAGDGQGLQVMLCTSKFAESIDLCWACSSKGTTMIALLEHTRLYSSSMELLTCLSLLLNFSCGKYPSSSMRRLPRMLRGV